MGLFDFLKGKGGENDERAVLRHAERVMDKRALSPDRFGSIDYLCKLASVEAWRALLPRYNFTVDPSITDREEKNYIFEALTGNPDNALEPVREYLRSADSLTWPIKMLRSILEREDLVSELIEFLATFETGYERNAERKAQIIAALEEEPDPRVTEAVMPFLEDFNEDVRFHSVRTVVAQNNDLARSALLKLMLRDTSMRIRTTVVEGLAERGWPIDADQRALITPILQAVPSGPWSIDKDLKITRGGKK